MKISIPTNESYKRYVDDSTGYVVNEYPSGHVTCTGNIKKVLNGSTMNDRHGGSFYIEIPSVLQEVDIIIAVNQYSHSNNIIYSCYQTGQIYWYSVNEMQEGDFLDFMFIIMGYSK